ncbi:MAG: hypothetical protein K2V38_08535 [Gemmataceae bacterium]|nr:hypothetical protein [Gemmataceae bacterium]
MALLATNRDLYSAAADLIRRQRENARTLEEYLRAVWEVASRFREQEALTPDEFFGILEAGFTAEPETLSDDFRAAISDHLRDLENADAETFQAWEYRLVRQVIDLR